MEKRGEFLGLRFAYRTLAVKHFGSNSFRAENLPVREVNSRQLKVESKRLLKSVLGRPAHLPWRE
jgi:hypothetical protein